MSVLHRHVSLRLVQMALGLTLMGLVSAPNALGAPQLDTATATGSGGDYSNVNVNAQSGTAGQNTSGTVSFTVFGSLDIAGPVTCLSVTGPDQGGGTPGSPTTAVLNLQDPGFGVVTVELVDNGGNGTDIISTIPVGRAPTDCSPLSGGVTSTLSNGRAIVFDASPLPTSKAQCKNGGWRNYPQFKNQGDCISFVENGK